MATINPILRFRMILMITVLISTTLSKSAFSKSFGNTCPEAPHATLSFLEDFLETSYNEHAKDLFGLELSELTSPVQLTNNNPAHQSYCEQINNAYPLMGSRGETNFFKAGQYFIALTYSVWETDIPDSYSYTIEIYNDQLESFGFHMFISDL